MAITAEGTEHTMHIIYIFYRIIVTLHLFFHLSKTVYSRNTPSEDKIGIITVPLVHSLFHKLPGYKRDRTRKGYFSFFGIRPGPARDNLQDHTLPFQDTDSVWLKVQSTASLTRRKVHNPYSTISFVNVLPSCSSGSECIYTQIFGIHFNINLKSKKITTSCSF